jgi:hypothetical protein
MKDSEIGIARHVILIMAIVSAMVSLTLFAVMGG